MKAPNLDGWAVLPAIGRGRMADVIYSGHDNTLLPQ
jgi:hypothetical protein